MTWKGILRRIGQFQSALLLSLLYLLLWVPVGLLCRVFSDWLHLRTPQRTNWWARPARVNDPAHVREPF